MNVCFSLRRHRFALPILLAIAVAAFPRVAPAGDFDCGSDIVPITEEATACEFESTATEELCGWVDLEPYDSAELPRPVENANDAELSGTVAAIATAACASAGVSVEQIVEPFAMVGPCLDNSLEMVQRFQGWWNAAAAEAEALRLAEAEAEFGDTIDVQEQLDLIATEEPVDVENHGGSVLVDKFTKTETKADQPGVYVTAIDMLVGGSPIIATIEEEDYLPYDLSARDIKLWSVFPISTRPFCVRSHGDDIETEPMWQDFDQLVANAVEVQTPPSSYASCGSADCLLDELIWRVEMFVAEDSPLWDVLAPQNLGRQVATIASGSGRLVKSAAQLLASQWPEVEEDVETSEIGQALLARAGAINASEPIAAATPMNAEPAVMEAQIAEAPIGTALR